MSGEDAGASARDDGGGPATGDGGARVDGGAPGDAGTGSDAGTSCDPPATPGEPSRAYCDLLELAIFTAPGVAPHARLTGRVSAGEGCAVIDEVEVQDGGEVIATFDGAGSFTSGDQRAFLASGAAVPELLSICGDDTRRFGGLGLIVRGRSASGSFEALCADAEGGGHWPPTLRITCHENVDDKPFNAYAGVSVSSMFGVSFSTLDVSVPHGPGGALLAAESTVRIIPAFASAFGAPPSPEPFDTTGWDVAVGEATAPLPGTYTSVQFGKDGAAFDTDLCPPPATGEPSPDDVPPPVFLARFRGTGERGAYSTEAYVDYCNTATM